MAKIQNGRAVREVVPAPQRAKSADAQPACLIPLRHIEPGAIVQRALATPQTLRPVELMAMQRTLGNRAVGAMLGRASAHSSLMVSAPGDRYESEAERVADTVIRAPGTAQEAPKMDKEPEPATRRAPTRSGGSLAAGGTFAHRLNASRGRGRPLPSGLQSEFESKFGADFSDVMVHTDAQADALSRSIQARAFTRGHDIYVAAGQPGPTIREGKRLLAHELTHVMQQDAGLARASNRDQAVPTVSGLGNDVTVQRLLNTANYRSAFGNKLKRAFDRAFDEYGASQMPSRDVSRELNALQLIEVLAMEWLKQNGSSNKEIALIEPLLSDVRGELTDPVVRKAARDQYANRAFDTQAALGMMPRPKDEQMPFQYITNEGVKALDPFQFGKTKSAADRAGLNIYELYAIRLYTAGDYKYINPVLVNDPALFEASLETVGVQGVGVSETTWAFPIVKEKLAQKDQKGKKLAQRQLRLEAMQHSRMVLDALAKLPDLPPTETYRGLAMTSDELNQYKKGYKAPPWAAFSSSSINRDLAEFYAKTRAGQQPGKVPVLMISTVTQGKDLGPVSIYAETEILLLPNAEFTVIEDPVQNAEGIFEVRLMQTPAPVPMPQIPGVPLPAIPPIPGNRAVQERAPQIPGVPLPAIPPIPGNRAVQERAPQIPVVPLPAIPPIPGNRAVQEPGNRAVQEMEMEAERILDELLQLLSR